MDKWLLKIINLVLAQASPQIREIVCSMLKQAAEKAKETKNPWDDVLIGLIQTIIDCPDN